MIPLIAIIPSEWNARRINNKRNESYGDEHALVLLECATASKESNEDDESPQATEGIGHVRKDLGCIRGIRHQAEQPRLWGIHDDPDPYRQ